MCSQIVWFKIRLEFKELALCQVQPNFTSILQHYLSFHKYPRSLCLVEAEWEILESYTFTGAFQKLSKLYHGHWSLTNKGFKELHCEIGHWNFDLMYDFVLSADLQAPWIQRPQPRPQALWRVQAWLLWRGPRRWKDRDRSPGWFQQGRHPGRSEHRRWPQDLARQVRTSPSSSDIIYKINIFVQNWDEWTLMWDC